MRRKLRNYRIRKIMITVFNVMILAGGLYIIGSCGAIETETIELLQGVKQLMIGGIIAGIATGGRYALGK